MAEYLLELRDISKSFPGVEALRSVNFDLRPGEVHVLMGENGAGKSTLMKIVAGLYRQDAGQVIVEGREMEIRSPADAFRSGIAMIHQELNSIPHMTIAENIFIGREPRLLPIGFLNARKMNADAQALFSRLGLRFAPKRKMIDLSVAESQMIEIAKAISHNLRILIMDEPTSAITENEVEHLFTMIGTLKKQGVGIVYISHKINEIFRIADRITVLRDGELISTSPASAVDHDGLITMMVGRQISNIFPKEKAEIGDIVLSVRGLSRKGEFSGVSFDLRAGEILGIAGLMGSGRTELVETIFGIRNPDAGSIEIRKKPVTNRSPADGIRRGMAIVSEDRKSVGLNLVGSVKENVSIVSLGRLCRFGIINARAEAKLVQDNVGKLSIKTPSMNQRVVYLSGGNQQKVVISKWLSSSPEIFILDEPTRGIDVGAKAEIHGIISNLAREGKALIMVSSELPEIIGMSDRVLVMQEGQVRGELAGEDLTQERIMRLAMDAREAG